MVRTGWFATKVKPSVLVCTAPPGCGARTCSGCKVLVTATTHLCTDDASYRALLALGARQGWSRCPGCSRMIELNLGCYHMTCLCKTEFCYLCRARWKTCACPQWDERRLYAAAEARVDGQRPDVRRAQAPRAAAVAPNPVRAPVQEERRVRQVDPPRPAAPRRPANTNANTGENRLSQARLLEAQALTEEARARIDRRVQAVEMARQAEAEQRRVQLARETERARLVREAMEDLRENHECAHTKWKYRHGGGKCQTCFHNLPIYLFVSLLQDYSSETRLTIHMIFLSSRGARAVRFCHVIGAAETGFNSHGEAPRRRRNVSIRATTILRLILESNRAAWNVNRLAIGPNF